MGVRSLYTGGGVVLSPLCWSLGRCRVGMSTDVIHCDRCESLLLLESVLSFLVPVAFLSGGLGVELQLELELESKSAAIVAFHLLSS